MASKLFNIVRKQRGNVSIFRRNLSREDAFREVKHWKRLARNAGGRVFFECVEVPEEVAKLTTKHSELDELITDVETSPSEPATVAAL